MDARERSGDCALRAHLHQPIPSAGVRIGEELGAMGDGSPTDFNAHPVHLRQDHLWSEHPAGRASQSVALPSCFSLHTNDRAGDSNKTVQVRLDISMYAGQPVLRHGITVTNLKPAAGFMTLADMVPYSLADEAGNSYRAFRVNQWAIVPRPTDFETFQTTLNPNGTAMQIQSGAHGLQCSWVAIRDQTDRGLFAGWEFDGLTNASVRHYQENGYFQLAAVVPNLHRPVAPGGERFGCLPPFRRLSGRFGRSGYRQRFVEAVLAKPVLEVVSVRLVGFVGLRGRTWTRTTLSWKPGVPPNSASSCSLSISDGPSDSAIGTLIREKFPTAWSRFPITFIRWA